MSVACLGLGLVASTTAHAQNLITNGGFETPQLSQGSYQYLDGLVDSWFYSGAVLINIATNSPWTTPSLQTGYFGNQVAGLQFRTSISQNLSASSTGRFDLTWLDAARPAYSVQDYTVSVFDNSANAVVSSETLTVIPGGNFSQESLVADLVGGDSYTLTFQGLDSGGGDATAFIDNVGFESAPAPVPGVLPLSLWIPFFAGFVWLHRRRMRAAT